MNETQEVQVWSLGREDPLEEEMATHSSILAWRMPWTEKPGGLQSMGLQRFRYDWAWKHAHMGLEKKKWDRSFEIKRLHTVCPLVGKPRVSVVSGGVLGLPFGKQWLPRDHPNDESTSRKLWVCACVHTYMYTCVHICVHVYVLRKVPKSCSEACSWIWSRCKVYESGHWKRHFSHHRVLNMGHMLRTKLPGGRACLSWGRWFRHASHVLRRVHFCSSPGRNSLPVCGCPPLGSFLHLHSFVVAGSGIVVKWVAWRPRFS